MAEIENPRPAGPADEKMVQAFEQRIGHPLPEEYRGFLLTHNGGLPVPDTFEVELDGRQEEDSVMCFFPLRDGSVNFEVEDLEELRVWPLHCAWEDLQSDLKNLYERELEAPLLPIGTDGSGNYLCVQLTGARRGAVLFLEHEMAETAELAESFTAFLDSLRESEQPDYAAENRQREMERACNLANEKFQKQNYAAVILLLEPFEDLLSPAMRKKLEFARKKR